MTHIFVCKINPLSSFVCVLSGFFESFSFGCDAKNTSAVCNDLAIFKSGSCMETVISVLVLEILKSMDRDTFFVFYRISITCKNNTNCCIVLKFQIDLIQFVSAVDCGTPLNENLARVQTEGGLLQGIGMTLYEDVWYNEKGVNLSNSLMQYKIPTRLDFDKIRVEFESSYEPTGPFGAKSIGEIVINTPAPAIAQAVYNATGVWVNELPITPEKILKGMHVI